MHIEYCQCCKLNHENGKGHIYSKTHIKKLSEWSERQRKRVGDCIKLAQDGYANPSFSEHSFWCAFCGEEIKDTSPMIVYGLSASNMEPELPRPPVQRAPYFERVRLFPEEWHEQQGD